MTQFSQPLIEGKLIKRYKRFFADIALEDGTIITSHCPNTGSMRTCGTAGDRVFVEPNDNPKRKLKYTWEYTATPDGYIGVNTQRPNQIVAAAIADGQVSELAGYSKLKTEVKYGSNSKIDILLENDHGKRCYVEVKNVTLIANDALLFPDAITTRGQKHLQELINVVTQGDRAVMFYLVNRPDGKKFAAAANIDPTYAKLLDQAVAAGVEVLVYRVAADLKGMKLGTSVPHDYGQ